MYDCLVSGMLREEYRLPGLRDPEVTQELLIIARCDYVRLHTLLASAVLLRTLSRRQHELQHCLVSRYTQECHRRQGWDGIKFDSC